MGLGLDSIMIRDHFWGQNVEFSRVGGRGDFLLPQKNTKGANISRLLAAKGTVPFLLTQKSGQSLWMGKRDSPILADQKLRQSLWMGKRDSPIFVDTKIGTVPKLSASVDMCGLQFGNLPENYFRSA
jgi:hypothetical protein